MTANEQDQWGLHILDFFNSNYGPYCNQEDGSIYSGHYMREYSYDAECETDCNYVEDNSMTQHSLPEEFSQLEVDNAAESSHTDTEQFHSSTVASDWLVPSSVNCYPAQEDTQEEANDTGHSSSCSSPGERSYDGEECSYYLELTDESALDGELGKRLNQMVPVPHVPRINGEIPTLDEATTDHQRLLDRLQLYDLVERKIQGDGNCQFRALSDQFYRSPEHHKFVRQQVVNQLKSHPESYEGYVPMEYDEYLQKMSKSGEWGDHVTLQAVADSYGIKIFLITSFKDTCYMEIIPKSQKSKRVIFLSFWAEVHYNSIYPQGGESFHMIHSMGNLQLYNCSIYFDVGEVLMCCCKGNWMRKDNVSQHNSQMFLFFCFPHKDTPKEVLCLLATSFPFEKFCASL